MQNTQKFRPIDCLRKGAVSSSHPLYGALNELHGNKPVVAGFAASQIQRTGGLGRSFEAYCDILDVSVKKALFELQSRDNILTKKLDVFTLIRSLVMMCATSRKRDGDVAGRRVADARALLRRLHLQLAGVAAVRHVQQIYLPVAQRYAADGKAAWVELESLLTVVPTSLAGALSQGRQDVRTTTSYLCWSNANHLP